MKSYEELQAFLVTSKLRTNVLQAFYNSKKPLRQMQLSKKLRKKQQNISLILRQLEKEGLVKCLTPEKKAWKVYAITEIGREVIKQL